MSNSKPAKEDDYVSRQSSQEAVGHSDKASDTRNGGEDSSSILYIQPAYYSLAGQIIAAGDNESEVKRLPQEVKVGEIVAWRAWDVTRNGDFASCIRSEFGWGKPKEGRIVDGGRPQNGTMLGIHAFRKKKNARKYALVASHLSHRDKAAFGEVYLWGDVIEHDDGYRAQFASIKKIHKVFDKSSYSKTRRSRLAITLAVYVAFLCVIFADKLIPVIKSWL